MCSICCIKRLRFYKDDGVSFRLRVKVGTLRGKYFSNFILSPLHPSGKLKTTLLKGYKALGD